MILPKKIVAPCGTLSYILMTTLTPPERRLRLRLRPAAFCVLCVIVLFWLSGSLLRSTPALLHYY